jgi:hypothetical protein
MSYKGQVPLGVLIYSFDCTWNLTFYVYNASLIWISNLHCVYYTFNYIVLEILCNHAIYFFHISSMKCDSIHFNIMSDIVWSCWSENRENTIIFSFCHIFIDWLVLSANLIIYIVACTSFHNNDLLKWVYTVYNGMNQQTTIICKQNIYIKQIYYFTDSFTLKELSNMKY